MLKKFYGFCVDGDANFAILNTKKYKIKRGYVDDCYRYDIDDSVNYCCVVVVLIVLYVEMKMNVKIKMNVNL